MARPVRWDLIADPSRYVRGFDAAERRSRQFQRHQTGLQHSTARFSATLGSIGGVAVRAVGGATVALGGLAAAGAALGLKTAANLETAEVAFTQLLGSAKRARGFLGQLKTFAAKTPFELPGLVDASRALVGAGTAAKDVIPILTALGDASGALGLDQERFGRVMLAVTQIMNRGKVQAEELNQITEAGIPVWQLLAKATGKPVPELQKLMQAGKLLAKDTLPALFEQMQKDYGGGMVKQSRTLNGVWSTFKDTISLALSDALQPLIPILKENLPKAAEAFQKSIESLTKWVKDNKDAIQLLGEVLKGIFTPQVKNARGETDKFGVSAMTLAGVLSALLEVVLRVVQVWLRMEMVVADLLRGIALLIMGAGQAVNVMDRLRGGAGTAGDAMVKFGRDLNNTAQRELQQIEQDARNAQRAIDALHGKTIHVTTVFNAIPGRRPGTTGGTTFRALQHGGIVRRPTMALIGEAGPEAVVPLHRTPGNGPLPGGAGRMVLEIRSGGSRMDDLLVEVLRKAVRSRGGDVQVVLGQG